MYRWQVMLAVALGVWCVMAGPAWARSFTDDLGRTVEVPDRPLRIVSLSDTDITIPLLELGVMPVASHGRVGVNGAGAPYLRSGALLTGVDFDTAPIRFIGATEVDLEAVANERPDLIIAEKGRLAALETLQDLAPTVVLDAAGLGASHVYSRLADLTGQQVRLQTLETRYQAALQALKDTVHPERYTVSVIQPLNGKISVYHTYRALGRVLRDAGFRFPPLIDAIPVGGRMEIGAERLPEIDADVIFDPYRADRGEGPRADIADMEALVPNFCAFLQACRQGRYVMVSREEAISNSYSALFLMVSMVQAQMAERPRVTLK